MKRVKAKTCHGWATYDASGNMSHWSPWRPDAIRETTLPDIPRHWHYLKIQGFTCRRADVVPAKPKPAPRRRNKPRRSRRAKEVKCG